MNVLFPTLAAGLVGSLLGFALVAVVVDHDRCAGLLTIAAAVVALAQWR